MKTGGKSKLGIACLLVFTAAAVVGITLSARTGLSGKTAPKNVPDNNRLVVHEWGTFTSIAGREGIALEWRPLNGPTDLPKFVHTMQTAAAGLRHGAKADLIAAVRMETPVLYFYSGNEMEVSVKVDFPRGKITEWYPQARSIESNIDWGRIKIMPGSAVNLPVEYTPSHYYPARDTDAAVIQVCATDGKPPEQEKFLFYRGAGTFNLPLSVRLDGEKIVLKNAGQGVIGHLIVFENRGGKIGYRTYDNFTGELTDVRPAPDKKIDSLLTDLKANLVMAGLYEKEADAMIETWRSSWFEEGLRVFYILPRSTTDAVLPLTIEPRPVELVRVLVGRAEVITPEMEDSVQKQVSLLGDSSPLVRDAAAQTIRKYGRFSEPILKRILENERDGAMRQRIKQLIATKA
jgi:hypothetical protein